MAAFGDTLRQARAHKGLSLIEAAQATYISRFYLDALEKENFSALPDGTTFRRGIVRHYATFLGLDPGVLLKLYVEASGDRAIEPPIVSSPPPGVPSGWSVPNFSLIGVVAILLAVGFTWFYSVYFGDSTRPETPTQIIATLTPWDPSALSIPSPTPKPPTPTPVPPTPTPAPPTPTPEEVVPPPAVIAPERDEEPVNYNTGVTSDQPNSSVTASVKIEALGYIYVSVVVDGAPAWDGYLSTGESTPFFNGSLLIVYTSDDSLTYYYSATTPSGFIMGGSGPVTYEFP